MAFAKIASTGASNDLDGVTTSAINTTGADLIVIVVASYNGTVSPTDSQTNTWTAGPLGSNGLYQIDTYYCVSPTTNASHTFSFSESTTYPGIAVYAASGVDTGDAFEASNWSNTGATGSITPVNDGALIITGLCHDNTFASTSVTGFTVDTGTDYGGSNNMGVSLGVMTQGTAATVSETWSAGTARTANIIAFNPGAGASVGPFGALSGEGGLAGMGGIAGKGGGLA
jgi:hypothetical protein